MKKIIYQFLLVTIASVFIMGICNKKDATPPPPDSGTVTDVEGNTYKTIKIGAQVWMAENLKVTKYRNGDNVLSVSGQTNWLNLAVPKTPAYCNIDDNVANTAVYGRVYNYNAATDSRGLAPAGWHLPSREEWLTLLNYLGGQPVAGGKMKETGTAHWPDPNAADNSSGFTAFYAKSREYSGRWRAYSSDAYTYWWTSTDDTDPNGYHRAIAVRLYSKGYLAQTVSVEYNDGLSVRCIKD